MGTSSPTSLHTQFLKTTELRGIRVELTTQRRDEAKMSPPSEHACLIVQGHPTRTVISTLMTQL